MQTAPRRTTNPPIARLRRWLYLRALTLGLALALAVAPPAALAADDAKAASAARAFAEAHLAAPGPEGAFAAAATPRVGGSGYFGGLTSNGWPVMLRMARSAERVRRVVAGVEFTCTSGDSFAIKDEWTNLPVRRRRFAQTATGTTQEAGLLFQPTSTVSGKLNRRHTSIAGTWRSTLVVRNPAGATVDSCDTGPLGFKVRR